MNLPTSADLDAHFEEERIARMTGPTEIYCSLCGSWCIRSIRDEHTIWVCPTHGTRKTEFRGEFA